MPVLKRYRIYCTTESIYVYTWDDQLPTVCPNNNTHTIDQNATTIVDSVSTLGTTDKNGRLKVKGSLETAYGELITASYSPLIQNYAMYNILNTQLYTFITTNGGTITGTSNGVEARVAIDSTNGSFAELSSSRCIKYRPGYGSIGKINCIFDQPVANCIQYIGLGNLGSDLFFLYNGMDFGVRVSTNGFAHVHRFRVTTGENSSRTATITLNGIAFSVPLTNSDGDDSFTAYEIANRSGGYTGWLVENTNRTVFFTAKTAEPRDGTYSFSSPGAASALNSVVKAGQNKVSTFVNRLNWNGTSDMVQNLDPQLRNMYSVKYGWYGSGNINFGVYNPVTSIFETVHTFIFGNVQIAPSITQPNTFIKQGVQSLGSITPKYIDVAGGFGAIEGTVEINYPRFSIGNETAIAGGTPTVVLALKNRTSVNGFVNDSEVFIKSITCSSLGNKPVRIEIFKNPTTLSASTMSDYTRWGLIDLQQSLTLYDVKSVSFTGGRLIETFLLQKEGNIIREFKNDIVLYKGEIVIVTATSTNNSEVDVSVNMVEDL